MIQQTNKYQQKYEKQLAKFMKLEARIEKLDRKKDPWADTLRVDIELISIELAALSAKLEVLKK